MSRTIRKERQRISTSFFWPTHDEALHLAAGDTGDWDDRNTVTSAHGCRDIPNGEEGCSALWTRQWCYLGLRRDVWGCAIAPSPAGTCHF